MLKNGFGTKLAILGVKTEIDFVIFNSMVVSYSMISPSNYFRNLGSTLDR